MAALSERLDDASSRLLVAAKTGAVSLDLPGLGDHSHQAADAPRLIPWHPILESPCTPTIGIRLASVRRHRSRCLAVPEASRRVFRGRAPPHTAVCFL
jgi:hypothetical protein